MTQLSQTHAASVKSFSLINAVSATVSPGEAKHLAANPAVSEVVPDLPIPLQGSDSPVTIAHSAAKASGLTPLPGACTTGKTVQLDPEAIENIHAATQSGTGDAAQALGYTGAGVKVAFIADGVNPDNPDFIRANGQHVFVDYQDFSGTGTNAPTDGGEAFLDSSSIAAQGREVYNVAGYGVGLSTACKIRILGVAPGASLVGLNVFGPAEDAYNSVFLEAINYAVNHDHVNVINESFGDNPFPDSSSLDLIKLANDAAVKAGVTVTVSSGDAGVTNTIGSPATDPNVISAGASTTYRAYAQTGIGDITAPGRQGLDRQQHQRAELGRLRRERLDRRRGRAGRPQLGAVHRRTRRCTPTAPTSTATAPRSSSPAAPARRRRSRPGRPRWSSRPTARRTTAPPRPRPWSSRSSCPPPRTSTPRATSRAPA